MKHKTNNILILLLLFSISIFAQETSPLPQMNEEEIISTEYQKVNGLENWTYNYDISDYPDGQYNLIIRSTDKAGNTSIDGPINILVDSESDLPVASISSPVENMRVGGDFTIIGTANDDDGVDFVEVRLDDGQFNRAAGKDFWSLYISVKSITDGIHTVTVRITDINGTQGKEVSKIFNLDTTKPEITVNSHNNGEILSGTVNIKGNVLDANGVVNLEYSLDGETFDTLKISGKKDQEDREFSLKIDTRDNEGGTDYIWFRSKDGTGSIGSNVFVYYSDNEKPEIVIKSPLKDDILNGFVTVSGTVHDEVGLAGFSYEFKKEEIQIPLIIGNPFWSQTFDFRGMSSSLIIFTAVDLSGNTESYKLNLKMDNNADLPLISLFDSNDNNHIENINQDESYLKGTAGDDDGVESIEYSIDKSEYKLIDSNGPFLIPIGDLAAGDHSIELYAVDIFGLKGKSRKFTFNIINTKPEINVKTFTADNIDMEPFFDGVIFKQGKVAKIEGSVSGGEGNLSAVYTMTNRGAEKVKVSNGNFSIILPKDFEEGGYDFKLEVTDVINRVSIFNSRIYFSPQAEKDKPYIPFQAEKKDGLFLIDSRLNQAVAANITINKPLTGYISGHLITEKVISPAVVDTENPKNSKDAEIEKIITEDTIRTAVLDPVQSNFKIEFKGSHFSIIPVTDTKPVSFRVIIETSMGKEYASEKINIGSDSSIPQLQVDDIKNSVLTDKLILTGTYSDNTEIQSAIVKFSGSASSYGSNRELKNEKNDDQNIFNMEIDLSGIEEGKHFYTVSVTDIFGNSKSETIPFILDRMPAGLSIIIPEPDVAVEGIITISGKIDNFENGGELLFSENGIDYIKVSDTGDNGFNHNVDLSKEDTDPESFMYRLLDRAGNITELKPDLLVDRELDRPKVSIEIPANNSTVRDDFKITGLVFDDDEVDAVFYSMDDGDFTELEGNKYFNIPYSIKSLSDGKHILTVRASDTGGFMSKEVQVTFIVSKAEPVSLLLNPVIEEYTKKTILLEGQSYDENGVESVYISFDNGITFNKALIEKELNIDDIIKDEPSEEALEENIIEEISSEKDIQDKEIIEEPTTVNWKYTLDTRLPGDGTHSILIKAEDRAGTIGIASTILNIDNTGPEVKLDFPNESESVAGNLIIDGKAYDGTKIKSVTAELKALNGEGEILLKEFSTEDVFREIINLEHYIPGLYNLTVTVSDYADNSISETRNLQIISLEEQRSIDIFFPEEGKDVVGTFVVEGRMNSLVEIKKAVLKVDDQIIQTTEIMDNGLYSFTVTKEDIDDGNHFISVGTGDNNNNVISNLRNIAYSSEGAWLKIENLNSGQFVSGRPMIYGNAGYDGPKADDKSKRIDRVEISLDNGRTFTVAKGRESWQFRLETYDLPEGINQLIVRSFLEDGQSCITKLFVSVDETAPEIDLFIPEENKKFNESVTLIGTAGDLNGLRSVEVLIREGRKEKYQIPSFIQGLYVDIHALGATYGELGVGLSFFDDVVKLQAQVGLAPPGRFSGLVIGGKLLANIVDLPFSYFFGHDWDFFSMSVAVGANFNYFTMSDNSIEFTDKGVVLGSVLTQFEFAKFKIKDFKMFNAYSLYLEGALWFISSDVQADIIPTYSIGTRIGIF
jgi:Bacterial Ig domain